ncbi:uncharacterized mitochondrial protein AtMg00810-like [Lathyrus oleraceus]|uniref:uncharacterized mitochondrial protein AtMg00810-like n=1 Tax=Pisum sativum TaxID=3888 RepID=UPI0021D1D9D3|nr:uncharacterized mitochondrial protein AtMg00810-like [Pisum sativum]
MANNILMDICFTRGGNRFPTLTHSVKMGMIFGASSFVKHNEDMILLVSLFVDGLIYTGNNQQIEDDVCYDRYREDEILPWGGSCRLTKDENGKPDDATRYKQMARSLMYLLASRSDLAYLVCLVARYMERPTEIHLETMERILRYLKGTVNLGVLYKMNDEMKLQGWSGSGYVGVSDDRKSTTGYVFKHGSYLIPLSSKKKPIATLLSIGAKFVITTSCACQLVWKYSSQTWSDSESGYNYHV